MNDEYSHSTVGVAKESAPEYVNRDVRHEVLWGDAGVRVNTGGMAYYSPHTHGQDDGPEQIVPAVLEHVREQREWGYGPLVRLVEALDHIRWYPAASLPTSDRP
ncbi:hypothetical protein ACIRBX_12090 [Kitasatospora sp. NPDC096147]|uniref:hypothetical protein n=1 Tax=Kitasatospora sp. NPDC096147 TaxID=3364093 RepID=UPI0037F8391F